jgi:hypothetical protein
MSLVPTQLSLLEVKVCNNFRNGIWIRATYTKIRTDASTVILETSGFLPLLAEADRGHAAMYEPQRVWMHGINGDAHEVAAADPTNAVPHVELRVDPIGNPPTPTSI